jgi:hypothetical protein
MPANWRNRRRYFGDFGKLRVYLVDAMDIFVSKLSSKQEKHKDDLRVLAQKLDMATARQRLLRDGRAFLDIPHLRSQIEENWRFIFQQPLFPNESTDQDTRPVHEPRPPKKRSRKKRG